MKKVGFGKILLQLYYFVAISGMMLCAKWGQPLVSLPIFALSWIYANLASRGDVEQRSGPVIDLMRDYLRGRTSPQLPLPGGDEPGDVEGKR